MKLVFAGLFFLFFVKFGIGRQLLIKVSSIFMKSDLKVFSMSFKKISLSVFFSPFSSRGSSPSVIFQNKVQHKNR